MHDEELAKIARGRAGAICDYPPCGRPITVDRISDGVNTWCSAVCMRAHAALALAENRR